MAFSCCGRSYVFYLNMNGGSAMEDTLNGLRIIKK